MTISAAASPLVADVGVFGESGRAVPGRARRELSPRVAALVGQPDVAGVYGSRSQAVAAVALAAVAAGWDRGEFASTLARHVDVPGGVGEWVVQTRQGRRRGVGDQERRVATTWRRAVERFFARPPAGDVPSVMLELAEVRHAMDSRPYLWGGQAGKGNRLVLEALLTVAERACRLDPTASVRQLAEMTTVTASTAGRAVARLVAMGWVRVDDPAGFALEGEEDAEGARPGRATARRLHLRVPADLSPPVDVDELADPVTGELPAVRWAGPAVHDAFVWDGLGGVAGLVYARLDQVPATAKLLAARLGFSVATVRGHLRRLAGHGLAADGARGWTRGAGVLDAVAVELGTAGTLAGRVERHAADRARWTALMTHFANRRGWREQRGLYRPAAPRLPMSVRRVVRPAAAPPQAA